MPYIYKIREKVRIVRAPKDYTVHRALVLNEREAAIICRKAVRKRVRG